MDKAVYQPPKLLFYAEVWVQLWIPFVRRHSPAEKYDILCRRNIYFLQNGWEIGEINPDNRPLNNRSYDIEDMPLEAEMAICQDLTKDALKGRIIEWGGQYQGECPIFPRPKKLDPITDEVLTWRVIRDGSCGSLTHPSVNEMTPDHVAALELVSHEMVQKYILIMYLLYGTGCYMGKADLAGAFRQFYWRKGETEKVLYRYQGRLLGDLQHIWGTRTGSRVCQNMTQIVSRAMMLWFNGPALRKDIDQSKEEANHTFFQKKFDEGQHYCPQLKWPVIDVWNWNETDVRRWIRFNALHSVWDILSRLHNGRMLLFLHRTRALRVHSVQNVRRLDESGFFDRLLELKLESGCCLKMISEAYVDDFMFILPPHHLRAHQLFTDSCSFIDETGFIEEQKKREEISTVMEFLGIEYDTEEMTMAIPQVKRDRMMRMLVRGLLAGAVTIEQYESLVGKLSYAAQLIWPAKAFLRRMRNRLQQAINQYGRNQHWIILTDWERKDWNWWIKYLNVLMKVSILTRWNPVMPTNEIYVDGATNGSRLTGWCPGIGVWYQGHWISMKVPPQFLTAFTAHDADYEKLYAIPHFEMLSVVLALHTLLPILPRPGSFMLRTDSMEVASALTNKSTKDEFLMDAVRWITMWAVTNHMHFHITYVHTKTNVIADHLSRFNIDKFHAVAQPLCTQNKWTMTHIPSPTLPDFQCW